MNFTKRTVLASGLGVLAASVWIPQLASRGAGPAAVLPESPADGAGEESASSTPSAAGETVPAGALEQLGSLEERLAELDAARGATDIGALLARLGSGSLSEDPAPRTEQLFAPEAELDPREELESFASRNPLTGVIHGPDRSAALLGHRVVRVGDVLAAGRITVAGIGPGWIELAAGPARLQVELPAFQARGGGLLPILAPAPGAPAAQLPIAPLPTAQSAQGGGA